jgi:hypothetical protein
VRARVTDVVRDLRGEHRKVVLVEPIPVSRESDNPEKCLSKAKYLEECRFVSHVGPTPEEQTYRRLAADDPGVVSVDLDRQVCPYLPICDPVVNGMLVRHDDNHMTGHFALSLFAYFERVLVANGVLAG